MLFDALFAWACITDVQDGCQRVLRYGSENREDHDPYTRLQKTFGDRWEPPSQSLEALGKGKIGIERNDRQIIGLRANMRNAVHQMHESLAAWRKGSRH
jgi:hypothetical protein